MPIANCIVFPDCAAAENDLIALWATESGQSAQHMTINIVTGSAQFGNRYPVMATLSLPSLWLKPDISALQTGLARALARYYQLPLAQVHVVTSIVEPGFVVEDGKEIEW